MNLVSLELPDTKTHEYNTHGKPSQYSNGNDRFYCHVKLRRMLDLHSESRGGIGIGRGPVAPVSSLKCAMNGKAQQIPCLSMF